MIVECCSQERSYSQFFGLIGERFCKLNRTWTDNFQDAFQKYYDTIHRYETNKLRNIARFFGHLLASDAISWAVMHVIHMNEEETTSSSRIFVKIMMQEMVEELGATKVVERFKIPDLAMAFAGMFPMDNPKNTRFAINYFTSIGMGRITEDMRTYLQNAPKMLAAQHAALNAAESSDSDSSSDITSSDSDSDLSSSESDTESDYSRRRGGARGGRKSDSRSPIKRRRYSSDSRSPPPRRRVDSRSPPPRRRADSRSPPPRRRADSRSPPPRRRADSRSPPPVRRRRSPTLSASPPRRRPSPPRRPDPRDARRRDDSRTPPTRGNGNGSRRDDDTPPRRR